MERTTDGFFKNDRVYTPTAEYCLVIIFDWKFLQIEGNMINRKTIRENNILLE